LHRALHAAATEFIASMSYLCTAKPRSLKVAVVEASAVCDVTARPR
jgi:hypothetical protein